VQKTTSQPEYALEIASTFCPRMSCSFGEISDAHPVRLYHSHITSECSSVGLLLLSTLPSRRTHDLIVAPSPVLSFQIFIPRFIKLLQYNCGREGCTARLAGKGIISFGLSKGPLWSDKMYPLPFGYFSNCWTRLGYSSYCLHKVTIITTATKTLQVWQCTHHKKNKEHATCSNSNLP